MDEVEAAYREWAKEQIENGWWVEPSSERLKKIVDDMLRENGML